jgi:hypothetical protein
MKKIKTDLSNDTMNDLWKIENGKFYFFPEAGYLVDKSEIEDFIANFEKELDKTYYEVSLTILKSLKLKPIL